MAVFDVVGGATSCASGRSTAGTSSRATRRTGRTLTRSRSPARRAAGETSRIPDVGNPWLDAGIVPFSTMHYRTDPDYWGQWFPADFITESFPGQFRNWFYSMLAMSTVLRREPPFKTIHGYATLFGEDGRPMHKSWGNSIEFNEAAERMGVDVMRWMYARQRPRTTSSSATHRPTRHGASCWCFGTSTPSSSRTPLAVAPSDGGEPDAAEDRCSIAGSCRGPRGLPRLAASWPT